MTNNKTLNRGGQTYEAPSVNLLDIQVEGVLCASDLDRADADYNPFNDLGEI